MAHIAGARRRPRVGTGRAVARAAAPCPRLPAKLGVAPLEAGAPRCARGRRRGARAARAAARRTGSSAEPPSTPAQADRARGPRRPRTAGMSGGSPGPCAASRGSPTCAEAAQAPTRAGAGRRLQAEAACRSQPGAVVGAHASGLRRREHPSRRQQARSARARHALPHLPCAMMHAPAADSGCVDASRARLSRPPAATTDIPLRVGTTARAELTTGSLLAALLGRGPCPLSTQQVKRSESRGSCTAATPSRSPAERATKLL